MKYLSRLMNCIILFSIGLPLLFAAIATVVWGGYFIASLVGPVDWPIRMNMTFTAQMLAVVSYIGTIIGVLMSVPFHIDQSKRDRDHHRDH